MLKGYGIILSISGICAIKIIKDSALPVLKWVLCPFEAIFNIVAVIPWMAFKVWKLERNLVD